MTLDVLSRFRDGREVVFLRVTPGARIIATAEKGTR